MIQTVATQPWRGGLDMLIEPDVHHVLWDEFVKTPQLIAAGADACYAALPKIQAPPKARRRPTSSQPHLSPNLRTILIFSLIPYC